MPESAPFEVLVVAGEASGDQHAAELVAVLRQAHPTWRFFGMGGPKLEAQGLELIHGAHEISVMGIAEVLPKIPRILKVLGDLMRAVEQRRPGLAILVDVPDFNLRLAKRLRRGSLPIKIAWYIAPMAWAWREGRTTLIAERTDELLCILPFEEPFFRARGVHATYVGSPVLDQLPAPAEPAHFRRALGVDPNAPVLAVLPGSRRSELARLLPTMAQVAAEQMKRHPGLRVLVPVAPGLENETVLGPFAAAGVEPTLVAGRAAEVVGASDVALVASGTAALEAGLMRRPLVVVYRVAPLTYWVGRAMVKLQHFSLVNLLAGRKVVPELLQAEVTVERVVEELEALWSGPAREACVAGLDEVRAALLANRTERAAVRAAERVSALAVTP